MMDGWKLAQVEVSAQGVKFGNAWYSHELITGYTADQLNEGNCSITGKAYMAWLNAPNPIACHVDESCGQGGGEVEVVGHLVDDGFATSFHRAFPHWAAGYAVVELVDRAHVTRLTADLEAGRREHAETERISQQEELRANDYATQLVSAQSEFDALKAEVERLQQLVSQSRDDADEADRLRHVAQSRLTQATAIIDYQWLHTELDAIAKTDIEKFYAGSTDAEKAARAEMVRVANEPAEGGL